MTFSAANAAARRYIQGERRFIRRPVPVFIGVIEGRANALHNSLICRGAWTPTYAGKTRVVSRSVFASLSFSVSPTEQIQ